jgi:hypothetical protein
MARKRKHNEDKTAAEVNLNGSTAKDAKAQEAAGKSAKGGGGGLGRLILLLLIATIATLALSEGARSKLLDLLFGAEEEFDYSSTTMPATETPVGAGAS